MKIPTKKIQPFPADQQRPHVPPTSIQTPRLRQKLTAEFVGTYCLVFAGTGAIVVNHYTHSVTHLGIALTFGLTVMAMIYAFGHISGAHLNPAVTLGFLLLGEIQRKETIFYITFQCLGAIAASSTLYFLFHNTSHLGVTCPSYSWQQSFGLEFLLTFMLMTVILGSAVHGKAIKSFAGVAIGSTVGLEALFGGPISGASMNPARSLGPALVTGTWEHLWIYLIATVLGALAASLLYSWYRD